jgi:hypothetical protein
LFWPMKYEAEVMGIISEQRLQESEILYALFPCKCRETGFTRSEGLKGHLVSPKAKVELV